MTRVLFALALVFASNNAFAVVECGDMADKFNRYALDHAVPVFTRCDPVATGVWELRLIYVSGQQNALNFKRMTKTISNLFAPECEDIAQQLDDMALKKNIKASFHCGAVPSVEILR